jgi:CRISPR-associated exonuclease Cas4
MNDLLLLLPLALLLIGIVWYWRLHQRRTQLHMPAGLPIYHDTQKKPGTLLYSHRYQVKGKPDFLYKQAEVIIPIEVKTGRTPKTPYFSHIMQLITYCVLVEETYGTRPSYGILRYPNQQFQIEFTPEREQALLRIVADMRGKRDAIVPHRSHNNAKACAACGYRERCEERLDL